MTTGIFKNNILILPSWYNDGLNPYRGIFFKEQALALGRYGYNVTVLAVTPYSLKDVIKNKKFPKYKELNRGENFLEIIIRLPNIPKLKRINYFLRHLLTVKYSKKLYFRGNKPEIIHVHSYKAGLSAITISKKLQVPYLVTEHSSELSKEMFSADKNAAEKVYRKAAKVIAVSSSLGENIEKKFQVECKVIPNMIDIDRFLPAERAKKTDSFTFINIGGLTKAKGGDILIDSFAKAVKKSKIDLKLVIAGNGNLKESMTLRAEQLELTDLITFKGYVSREDMPALITSADALLITSKYETFGIALIEAMACGLPVVSTKCGGPEDIITSDKLGILTDMDSESVSDGMIQLINRRNTYDKKVIRKSIEERFSEKAVVEKLKKIYNIF